MFCANHSLIYFSFGDCFILKFFILEKISVHSQNLNEKEEIDASIHF